MQIYLLINNKCNLSCPFCIRGKMDGSSLDVSKWINVLKNNDFQKSTLLITGGEPSLFYDINLVIGLSKNNFRAVCINTNGLDSNWLDTLTYKDIHVQISLDGDRITHNTLRGSAGQDIFAKVEDTIRKIENLNIPYNISTTVNRLNASSLADLHSFLCQCRDMKYWKISPELPVGCSQISNTLDISEWNNLVDYLISISKIKIRTKKLFHFALLDRYIHDISFKNKTNCGNVKDKIYIYPDLTVYPCTCLTDFPLGNLENSSLDEILSSNVSRLFLNYKVKQESDCHNCKYLRLCNGGCIGMSYLYFGELGRGDYRCPLVKI